MSVVTIEYGDLQQQIDMPGLGSEATSSYVLALCSN